MFIEKMKYLNVEYNNVSTDKSNNGAALLK